MSPLASAGRRIIGLLVDDAFLSAAIVATILVTDLCSLALGGHPRLAGALLAGGCLLSLTLGVARAAAAKGEGEGPPNAP